MMRSIEETSVFLENLARTGSYRTPPERLGKRRRNGLLTSFEFNLRGPIQTIVRGAKLAKKGLFDNDRWQECGLHLLWEAERMGTEVILEGFERLKGIGPAVLVGNHMSLYETFVFPPLMLPFNETAIVLKASLLRAPLLGLTLSTRKTIAVGRTDPRADLKTVLARGEEMLRDEKCSVLLYPQGTRQPFFDVHHFNTLGIKLAQNAEVPIVPIAAQTAFLGVGKYTKDFGPVNTDIPVRFAVGDPITVTRATAKAAHAQCIDFIASKLEAWGKIEVRR